MNQTNVINYFKKNKILFIAVSGNFIETFDFIVYIYLLNSVFTKIFFNGFSNKYKIKVAVFVIILSALFRLIGAVVFGYMGDKYGRKKPFKYSIAIMIGCTFFMFISPTYNQIGFLSPILLIINRSIQSFCASAEISGSLVYVFEQSEDKNKFFNFGLAGLSYGLAGFLASSSVYFLNTNLPEDYFLSWGWRLIYLISFIAGVFLIRIRGGITETKMFEEFKKNKIETKIEKINIKNKLKNYLSDFRYIIFVVIFLKIIQETLFQYYSKIIINTASISTIYKIENLIYIEMISNLTCLFLVPIFGYILDSIKISQKNFINLIFYSSIVMHIFVNLFMQYYKLNLKFMILIGVLIGAIKSMFHFFNIFCVEMLPIEIRYRFFLILGNLIIFLISLSIYPGVYLTNLFNSIIPIASISVVICFISLTVAKFFLKKVKSVN